MNNWIKCDEELPPCDGYYEISTYLCYGTLAFYDGVGFMVLSCYRHPTYWRNFKIQEKRYGKIKDLKNGQKDQKD